MAIIVTATKSITVGSPAVVQGDAPEGELSAVFEDDGDTGYFYFLDYGSGGQPIQDAIRIYNVADVADKHLPSKVEVAWSLNGANSLLLVNGHPQAAFDSTTKLAYSRTGSPAPAPESSWRRAQWSDEALALFPDEPSHFIPAEPASSLR